MAEIQEEPGGAYVVATECSICDRPIPPEAHYPLCPRCEGSARAHARLAREASDWIGQEGASFGSR